MPPVGNVTALRVGATLAVAQTQSKRDDRKGRPYAVISSFIAAVIQPGRRGHDPALLKWRKTRKIC